MLFTHLVPPGWAQQIHVVPAEKVHLHLVTLPIRSARQRLAALPFALEDHVAQSLDAVHCAACGTGAAGEVLAATVERSEIEAAVAAHPGKMLVPEQLLLPAPASQEDGAVTWHSYRQEDRVLVRSSDLTGFACHTEMFEVLWRQAGQPLILNVGAPLDGDLPVAERRELVLADTAALAAADLRQGAFQPSRGLARPLKWLAASLAMAALVHLALLAVDTSAQRAIADDLRVEADAALAGVLPGASADDAPDLVLRRVAARTVPQTGSGFLPVMEQVSRALADGAAQVSFRDLAWTEDALRLTVEAPGLEALQAAQATLESSGLAVSSGSATASDGSARADLTVRP